MNPLDSVISFFSPTAGLKRAQARKVLRTYQGAEANRLTNHKKPRNQAADQELLGPFGADSMRAWARALVRDNAYAWNVVDTIVSNVIGDGITAQSTLETFEGEAHGQIVWPPRGDKGFGYDPMFQASGETRTFGEMSHEEKLPLTHRARAFEKFLAALR